MKTLLSLAFLAMLTTLPVVGQESTNDRATIVVSGSSEIMVPPDEVVFSLDVTKRNMDLQTAKRESDATLTKVLDLTRRFGIASQDVRTDYISVERKYNSVRDPNKRIYDEDGDEIGTRVFLGYDVSTTVIVKLKDLKRFEEFFAGALNADVTEVEDVTFQTSNPREHRDKAREMAMKAAFEKATAMAGAINQTIGKAISITEVDAGRTSISGLNSNSNIFIIDGAPTAVTESVATFSPGAIKITAQVNVTFLLD